MAINPKIKQKAEDIRSKIFGSEVRESLASGLEGMSEDVESIKGRQGNVENQFQDVLDETTGKDVTSAPEILAARGGHNNLAQRLLSTDQQLQQTKKEAVSTVSHDLDNKIIVTFIDDDGANGVWTVLKPLFERHGVPLSIAVVSSWIDKEGHLSLAQLKSLKDNGHEIVSHTHTHKYLGTLDEAGNEYEIGTAASILNSHGFDGNILVYPYASVNDFTLAKTRKYSVAGVAGKSTNHYNNMPLNTFLLNRRDMPGANGETLENAKATLDNAPAGSWIIYYSHVFPDYVNNPKATENIKMIDDFLTYVKGKNVEVVTLRQGLERKGNILDVGDKNNRYRIARNGIIDQEGFPDGYDNLTPITYFPHGETKTYFNTPRAQTKKWPEEKAGTLITVRTKNPALTDYDNGSYQEYHLSGTNIVYKRRWNQTTTNWQAWQIIAQPIGNMPFDVVDPVINKYTAATPITDFPTNKITTSHVNTPNATGLPNNKAGVLITTRIGGSGENGYSRQEHHEYNGYGIWKRYVKTDGTWSDWQPI